jgi:hypothetical protein
VGEALLFIPYFDAFLFVVVDERMYQQAIHILEQTNLFLFG